MARASYKLHSEISLETLDYLWRLRKGQRKNVCSTNRASSTVAMLSRIATVTRHLFLEWCCKFQICKKCCTATAVQKIWCSYQYITTVFAVLLGSCHSPLIQTTGIVKAIKSSPRICCPLPRDPIRRLDGAPLLTDHTPKTWWRTGWSFSGTRNVLSMNSSKDLCCVYVCIIRKKLEKSSNLN